jgi:hypothetical protein
MSRLIGFLGAAAAALALAASASTAPASPFSGTWWAVDPSDNSLEQLTFGAGGSLFFRDDSAHTCGGVQAFLTDVGTISGDTWTGSGNATLVCPSVGETRGPVFFEFALTPDGTLVGDGPEEWTRARP